MGIKPGTIERDIVLVDPHTSNGFIEGWGELAYPEEWIGGSDEIGRPIDRKPISGDPGSAG